MSGLGDLLELMFTARRRYRTLRLVLRIWQDPEVAELLRRELVRRAEESPSSGMVIAVLSASESSDAEPVPAERIDRIWFSAPHRYRDVRGPQGAAPGMWSVIDGGWRTSRWDGEAALRQPVRGAEFWEQAFQEHRPLVDPSVLLSGVDLRITGRTEAIAVRRSPSWPPNAPTSTPAPPGGTPTEATARSSSWTRVPVCCCA